jgi:hypothetical protein
MLWDLLDLSIVFETLGIAKESLLLAVYIYCVTVSRTRSFSEVHQGSVQISFRIYRFKNNNYKSSRYSEEQRIFAHNG